MNGEFYYMFSKIAKSMKASEIRELLKLTERKEIISFAGGLPNPKAFPVEKVKLIINDLLENKGAQILQYGTTEGVTELRQALAERMQKKGMKAERKNILVTAGSQQALDLISKVFLEPGDVVVLGAPTYLGGTNAFRSYGAIMEGVPLDNEGMPPDLLEDKMHLLRMHGKHPKLLYLVPSFHNPAGVTIPENRRKKLIDIAIEYDMVLVEDSPYSELRYSGKPVNAMKSMDKDGRIIYMGTFSKILAPGFRIAWCVADGEILNKLIIVKQAADLCTNTFGQHIAAEYLTRGYLDEHITKIKDLYMGKRDLMLAAMEKHFPKEAIWTKPDGGMFIWVTLPECIDTKIMFDRAIENKVAYVNGAAFHADRSGKNTMRLNYTFATDEQIGEGIKRLADTIREEMKAHDEAEPKTFEPDEEGLVMGV